MRRQYILVPVLVAVIVAALLVWSWRSPRHARPGESGSTTLMTYSDPATGATFEAPLNEHSPPTAPSGRPAEYVYECAHHDPPHTWTEPTFHIEATCPECGGMAGPLIVRAPPKTPPQAVE